MAAKWPIARTAAGNVADSACCRDFDLQKANGLRANITGPAESEPNDTLNWPHSCDSGRTDTLSRPH
jgi:hypothetical protein